MERPPENLAFFKCCEGWSYVPPCCEDKERNTFFTTPLFASKGVIQTYRKPTLLACLEFLRDQAKHLNGIDSLQTFYDLTDERPGVVFIEEVEGDRGVGPMFGERPHRTVAVLEDEFCYSYFERNGDEWLKIRKVEV